MMDPTTVELNVDGRTVMIDTVGPEIDPARPTVVFVHGAGCDRTVWSPVTPGIAADGFGVLAVDLPGHGGSDGPVPETIPAFADWLDVVLGAAGLESAAVVGHSLGSYIALELAARHAGRVTHLAMAGTADRMPVHPMLLDAARDDLPLAADLMSKWSLPRRPEQPTAHDDAVRTELRELIAASAAGVLLTDLSAANAYDGTVDAAAKVDCPMLVLLGAGDRMTPPDGATALIEASTTAVILSDTGHAMTAEDPDAVVGALRSFLSHP